ncbi:MAG TPA: hypothetical protein VEZ11_13285 [Thermoanaerobaculia bacterium]|nr:hypothetical protein [Thermoanaerobaculia bacterium]
MTTWDSRRILRELADSERRRKVLTTFWKGDDLQSKALATAQIAKALHFREETIRKMPAAKKADLLAARIGSHEVTQFLDMALMQYHTKERGPLMAAFLDRWKIPHVNGTIETDTYDVPSADQVREAVAELEGTHDRRDIAIYLATAGLLMGEEWRAATWPVVEELAAGLS